MEELNTVSNEGFSGRFLKRIPAERKARVTTPTGTSSIVNGPAWRFAWNTVEPLDLVIVPQGEEASYTDERGAIAKVEGPQAVHVHPEGTLMLHQRMVLNEQQRALITKEDGNQTTEQGPKVVSIGPRERIQLFQTVVLQAHEACVVFGQDGKPKIHYGKDEPIVFVDPRERLHQFRLTGGGDEDGFAKVPGKLNFSTLRLQETQAYFALLVRTQDNTVLRMKLMIFLEIVDVEKFIGRDDPFGALFNDIMARVVGEVQTRPFDTFKNEIATFVAELAKDPNQYAAYGIKVPRITLRGWVAEDRNIQHHLDQAAAANTLRGVQVEQHKAALEKIVQERAQLGERLANQELERQMAAAAGTAEAARLTALHDALTEKIGSQDLAARILLLNVAGSQVSSGGGHLHLGEEHLRISQ